MDPKDFERLLAGCVEVAALFPDGVVFIGGIAVYLHARNLPSTSDLAELTHDADFYISLPDMGDLRDLEEVTPNRRLSKHQMIKDGFEYDIYTERQSRLIVPYDSVRVASEVIGERNSGGIRVAALEHLLVLKLEAYKDRRDSSKGDKDAKDLLRIAAVAERGPSEFDVERVVPFLRPGHMDLLHLVARGSYAMSLARGNAKQAKGIRECLNNVLAALEREEP